MLEEGNALVLFSLIFYTGKGNFRHSWMLHIFRNIINPNKIKKYLIKICIIIISIIKIIQFKE